MGSGRSDKQFTPLRRLALAKSKSDSDTQERKLQEHGQAIEELEIRRWEQGRNGSELRRRGAAQPNAELLKSKLFSGLHDYRLFCLVLADYLEQQERATGEEIAAERAKHADEVRKLERTRARVMRLEEFQRRSRKLRSSSLEAVELGDTEELAVLRASTRQGRA